LLARRQGWTRVALAGLALAAVHGACVAQIYAGTNEANAGVVLSNFRTDDTPLLILQAPAEPAPTASIGADATVFAGGATSMARRLPAAPADVRQIIDDVAKQVKIAPELLHAVIAAESNYNSRALSPRGAIGLMQLIPATATRFGATDPYVARQNVLAGASYLKWLMALFNDDLELVLAAYNAGEQAVIRAGGRIPPYPETMAYVPRVLAYLRCARSAACRPAA
jgi:soluble lytic murein transglycosylase-like protein